MRWVKLPVFVVLALAVYAGRAEGDLRVYDDALQNGFQTRYWNFHTLTSTSPVHSGTYAIRVAPASGWQGLYLHHQEFDDSPYSSVSFWVNGGTNGGQRLQVQGLAGTSNPPADIYYRFSIEPGTWQQITIPLASLGVANSSNFTGFWILLTPGGDTNAFYVDDIQLNAATAAVAVPAAPTPPPEPVPVIPSAPPLSNTASGLNAAMLFIAGSLAAITCLLAWLVLMFHGFKKSQVPAVLPDLPMRQIADQSGLPIPQEETLETSRKRLLSERVASELTEFAKQSLVQGLYSQRSKLIQTQQRAQAELAALEARLTALQLPLEERIRAYETRIGELEKELESRDDEMRHMIQATLMLVRDRLDKEKAHEGLRAG